MSTDPGWEFFKKGKDVGGTVKRLLESKHLEDSSRCQLAAAFLISLWQLSGRTINHQPPSLMLINALPGPDTIHDVVTRIIDFHRAPEKRGFMPKHPFKNPPPVDPRMNNDYMRSLIERRDLILRKGEVTVAAINFLENAATKWQEVRMEVFPSDGVVNYREAWSEQYGLKSGHDGHVSLLVSDEEDFEALVKDLAFRPDRLLAPRGFGDDLAAIPKTTSLIGTVDPYRWNTLMGLMTYHEMRVLFLPHFSPAPIVIDKEDEDILRNLAHLFPLHYRRVEPLQRMELTRVVLDDEALEYEEFLRTRLAAFPARYSFMILSLIRQLQVIALRLVPWIGKPNPAGDEKAYLLCRKLWVTALRGITYGIEAMAFHGHGKNFGNFHKQALEILGLLRHRDSATRREIQRKFRRILSPDRDLLLARLAGAGLVSTTGQQVKAVGFRTFLSKIASRQDFPNPAPTASPQPPAKRGRPRKKADG